VSEASGPAPRAHGGPVLRARLRETPGDFRVEELDAFDASGGGEHLLLAVEKRALNTAFVARRIARWAGVPESAVGYAGTKDRHAVVRQRFTVHLPGRAAPPLEELAFGEADTGEGLRVLHAARHVRKLARGALAGNRFVLALRRVQGEPAAIEVRLQAIRARGVPNAFGSQRFGRGGGNVARALAMFSGRRVRREERSMLLSAARSELFNRVLAARVAAGCWDRGLDGEVWMLDGSRSVFGPVAADAQLQSRLEAFDIHPTAPLWGRGELRSAGAARALELAALDDPVLRRLREGLEAAGLRQERRATRLCVRDLSWSWPDPATLRLEFALPPGSYATSVLAELGEVEDVAGEGAAPD
jgi:tRNA pseudouridine13 synthase